MSSRMIHAALVLTLAALTTDTVHAQQSLQWKFRPGEKLNYIVQQDMRMSMDYNGRDIVSTMKQTIDTVWTIHSVDRGGNAQLTQKINRIRIAMDGGPLGKVEYDTATMAATRPELSAMTAVFRELTRAEIRTTMSPTGKILSIQVPQQLLTTLKNSPGVSAAGFDEESLKQMFNQSGVIMSQTPVQPGSRWTASNQVRTPSGTMVFDSVLNFRGLQDYEGRKYARIDLKPSVRMVPDPKSPVQVRIRNADGNGAVLFDHENGRILRTKLSSKMLMSVTQNEQTIDQTIDQSVSMRLVPVQVASAGGGGIQGE